MTHGTGVHYCPNHTKSIFPFLRGKESSGFVLAVLGGYRVYGSLKISAAAKEKAIRTDYLFRYWKSWVYREGVASGGHVDACTSSFFVHISSLNSPLFAPEMTKDTRAKGARFAGLGGLSLVV